MTKHKWKLSSFCSEKSEGMEVKRHSLDVVDSVLNLEVEARRAASFVHRSVLSNFAV